MATEKWQHVYWNMIHEAAKYFPDHPTFQEKQAAVQLYKSIYYFLPCPKCKEHYNYLLTLMPIENVVEKGRHELMKWTWEIHNYVNEKTGKPKISFEAAYPTGNVGPQQVKPATVNHTTPQLMLNQNGVPILPRRTHMSVAQNRFNRIRRV